MISEYYPLPYRVRGGRLNVREAPGKKSKLKFSLESDSIVGLLYEDDESGWWYINSIYGNGWVDPQFLGD